MKFCGFRCIRRDFLLSAAETACDFFSQRTPMMRARHPVRAAPALSSMRIAIACCARKGLPKIPLRTGLKCAIKVSVKRARALH
jgi:hypothetical protein